MQDKTKPRRTVRIAKPRAKESLPPDTALNQTVYDALFDAILAGKLKPAAKLAEL